MRAIGFLIALSALLFWSAAAFDMWATLTNWRAYGETFPWQGAPAWRNVAWGASIAIGLGGAVGMFRRARWAGDYMLTAVGFMTAGLAYDVVLGEGLRIYGQSGVAASAAIVGIASLFTWIAYQLSKSPPIVLAADA
jgi:hypothetical protein